MLYLYTVIHVVTRIKPLAGHQSERIEMHDDLVTPLDNHGPSSGGLTLSPDY